MKTYKEQLQEIATVIYLKCIESIEKILFRGQSCGESHPQIAAAKMAVRYAVELMRQVNKYDRFSDEEKENF